MAESRFGHWEVAGNTYKNKLQAVVHAVPNGWWPHFNFREREFSLYDWTKEPQESLQSLYWARARQIRKDYDHVTVEFSGGVDSWYILHSFVAQGLHVDVVSHRFIEAGAPGDINDFSAKNTSAEGKYQAYPWYQKFRELDPYIQWHSYQATEKVIQGWARGPLDPLKFNRLHVAMSVRVPGLSLDIPDYIPKDKKCAVVHGVDKPNLYFDQGKFYYYFPDYSITGIAAAEREDLDLPWQDVFFYYDPQCCDLLIKQAHVMMRWFQQHPDMVNKINNKHYRDNDFYNGLVKSLIYPEYKNMWQTKKPGGLNVCDHETWFHETCIDDTAGKNWFQTQKDSSDIIEQMLLGTEFESWIKKEDRFSVLPSSWSKLYYLGDL